MTRERFSQSLIQLRDQILTMGSIVAEELRLAMAAFDTLDLDLARQVSALDRQVNEIRFSIEDQCFMLLVTQHPAASDLRLVFSAANMIVDLERMGDQTKGIAKLIPELRQVPGLIRPAEIRQMGDLVATIFDDALRAFADADLDLSTATSQRDDEVDALFAAVFTTIMAQLTKADSPDEVRALYDLVRVARELERFGDLVTNFAERSVYLITGQFPDQTQVGPISGRRR